MARNLFCECSMFKCTSPLATKKNKDTNGLLVSLIMSPRRDCSDVPISFTINFAADQDSNTSQIEPKHKHDYRAK